MHHPPVVPQHEVTRRPLVKIRTGLIGGMRDHLLEQGVTLCRPIPSMPNANHGDTFRTLRPVSGCRNTRGWMTSGKPSGTAHEFAGTRIHPSELQPGRGTETLARGVDVEAIHDLELLDPFLESICERVVRGDLIDEPGLSPALGNHDRPQDPTVVDPIDVDEIEMPWKPSPASTAIGEFVDFAEDRVVPDIREFGTAGFRGIAKRMNLGVPNTELRAMCPASSVASPSNTRRPRCTHSAASACWTSGPPRWTCRDQ